MTPPEALESDTPAGPTAPPGAAEVPKSRKDEGFPTWGFDEILTSPSIKNLYIVYNIYIYRSRTLKERLRAAARQQLRRMMAIKKKRSDLDPPEWLREAYNSRKKGEMADLLVDCNFSKDWGDVKKIYGCFF